MFHRDHWAGAFINALGENADAGLVCLKALSPPVMKIRGALFGRGAAMKLEKILRDTFGAAAAADTALEYAIRFITLLVEKDYFRHIDSVLQRIEKKLDARKGILDVTAEAASPLDSGFEGELRRQIAERTGAAGINMRTCVVPELLGGYRLRIGGFFVDASLKGQLEQMTAELRQR